MTHRHTNHEHEHEFEAAPGLPAPLPRGERLLWQGAPDWRLLAVHAFHVRKLAGYFLLLLAVHVALQVSSGMAATAIASGVMLPIVLAAFAIGIASTMAWLTSRATVYTLTDRRIVMRIGVVLTVTFNLPYTRIDAAAFHVLSGQAGDIALRTEPGTRIAWLHLWPHARPWRVARTEPMLRSLADGQGVAQMLVQAWSAARTDAACVAEVRPAVANPAGGPVTTAPHAVRDVATAHG